MAPERVTITIRSELGEDGPLTVNDALRQVLDFFDLLSEAQGENAETVSWRLVSVTKNSPLEAIAEPFSDVPGIDVTTIARNAKRATFSALDEITSGGDVPSWMSQRAREKMRSILTRNTHGVGRTDIKIDDVSPVVMLVQKKANVGLVSLRRAEDELSANEPDLSRSEIGSVDGFVAEATTYRRQPALNIRERRTGAQVLCVLSEKVAERAGAHSWREVWDGARVLVYGRIQFNRKGVAASIRADDIIEIAPKELSYATDVADSNFTGGLEPVEYLAQEDDVA